MAERNNADNDNSPEDELRRLIEQMLRGGGTGGTINPDQLAGVAGLPGDAAALAKMLQQLQQSLMAPSDEFNWEIVRDSGRSAATPNEEIPQELADEYARAFTLAEMWLGEVTGETLNSVGVTPTTITRYEWLNQSLDGWAEVSEPVATSISNALMTMLTENVPEEFRMAIGQQGQMLRSVGHSMFAMQLGQVLGQLAKEVLSGGDIGMPVLPPGKASLVPQNLDTWSKDLENDRNEVLLFFAVRELAYAQLFEHARWLRLHLVSSITEFARGINIDVDQVEGLVREIDMNSPEDLKSVLKSGKLIPPRTPEQELALARLETVLALIEGWVDVVTEAATFRLPNAGALAEMVRRRRATGSPAEHAFGSLVGLEIRPRRQRDAANMWRLVSDKLGNAARDQLWEHRDAVPTSDDIDDPFALLERLSGGGSDAKDELDSDLERLLGDPSSFGDAPAGGDTAPGDSTGRDGSTPPTA
ncbi:zinc-dependent metalloprotease [Gulosibacter bifidus]|uniref:Zinc-dependent metalloprotease n=1 Tax=Gulosibacter bifidus TaxID=272239 RepID=A0ABW5RHB4_9MICO|nr:zinc-dependent metalloprotease [Gulosibacter bifidus]